MYSPDSFALEDYGRLVIRDLMKLRSFSNISIDTVIDIGASIGVATIFSKMIFPKAKIISIEPCKENFDCLEKNTHFIHDVHREHKAFGISKKKYEIVHEKMFINTHTKENISGDIEGISLQDIFTKYNIPKKSKYFIKSDCEGSEQYFIDDIFSEQAIRQAEIFFMEVHFYCKQKPRFPIEWKTYNNWIHNNFSNTHIIDYYKSKRESGYGHYLLRKKGS